MWLVSCRRQGPALDPKCKFIISSFLAFPHLLDCPNCKRNVMSIVLLIQIMEGMGQVGMVDLYEDVGWGTGSGYHLIVFVFFLVLLYFVLSLSQSLYSTHQSQSMVTLVFVSLSSLFLVPSTRDYYYIQKLFCLLCKTILKGRYLIIVLWISLGKGGVF